jgi:hypothetical protein
MGIGVAAPALTPMSEIVPPRRTLSIAAWRTVVRSLPIVSISFAPTLLGSLPTTACIAWTTGAPCASINGVDDRVCAAARGRLEDLRDGIGTVLPVDHFGAVAAGQPQSFGDEVDSDDPLDAEVLCDPDTHLPDRSEPVDDEGAVLGRVGVADCLPGGREDV